jgi:hypothetical protein
MSIESCGGPVPFTWEGANDKYFLRDDSPICGLVRWSLFRQTPEPYVRLGVFRCSYTDALREACKCIETNRRLRRC